MDLSETSAYPTLAFMPSISVQGLRSPLGGEICSAELDLVEVVAVQRDGFAGLVDGEG